MEKRYSELILLPTFEERFEYLKLGGIVGDLTFGSHRYLNQVFYNSPEWKTFRRDIIIRDNGCDLAVEGYSYERGLLVHHINPITVEDVLNRSPLLFDPENVVLTVARTHKALHYGGFEYLEPLVTERKPFDTVPWKG